MFREAHIARCLRLAFVGQVTGLALVGSSAFAQVADVERGERVEVTGSNIRRVQSETASPVQTVTRADIDRSGKTNVAELLQALPIDNHGSVPATFGNGFSRGQGIALRGLGVGATLVLINGRRVTNYAVADDGTKTYVDLTTIPTEAVERIEILKDGGSSVYGSDAIAGVVNIILRREYNGLQAMAQVGQSLEYGDGRDTHFAMLGGFGDLATDRFNVVGDLEYRKKEPVYFSNRTDRDRVGKSDLRSDGYTANDFTYGGGFTGSGSGVITLNGSGQPTGGTSSVNGNVRNPATLNYYNRGNTSAGTGFTRAFPGAACSNFTSHAQGDPGGGCITDTAQDYRGLNGRQENWNSYLRGTLAITDDISAYAEGGLFYGTSSYRLQPGGVNFTGISPTQINTSSVGLLAANHPDNPYFGTAARLRYLTTDIPREYDNTHQNERILIGFRGTAVGWDFDTAFSYSNDKTTFTNKGFVRSDVLNALLNPTPANVAVASANSAAYAALPANTFYRIAENAYLNSPDLYKALAPDAHSYGKSHLGYVDFKASREMFNLPGGPLGVAFGGEFRQEQNSLSPVEGTERANINNGYSAYSLSRHVEAGYAELNAPVIKQVELSVAGRYDHYTYAGGAFSPKAGIKITPIEQIAIRGTFTRGFRAPNAPESGGSVVGTASSSDPVRCALGVLTACQQGSAVFITTGNPKLSPERSKVFTGGLVLDPTKSTSISLDYFKIIRKNEIRGASGVPEDSVLAGNVIRDPNTTQPGVVGDPGALVAILSPYINADRTTVRGVDVDVKQDVNLSSFGKLSLSAYYTHLFQYQVIANGQIIEYVNTHGPSIDTNDMGTPSNRLRGDITYSYGPVSVSTIANWRGSFVDQETKTTPCRSTLASGKNVPDNCRIGSFTSFDLSARWQATKNAEIFGSIQNVFDRKPPIDATTYGGLNYNPLDASGVLGRFFAGGARVKF